MMTRLKKWLISLVNWLAGRYATEVTWSFDSAEARGRVRLIRGGYGVYINLPEINPDSDVAIVDLYYRSSEGQGVKPEMPYTVSVWPQDELEGDPVYSENYYLKEVKK